MYIKSVYNQKTMIMKFSWLLPQVAVNSRRPRVSGGRGSRVEQSAGRCHFFAIAVDIQETV